MYGLYPTELPSPATIGQSAPIGLLLKIGDDWFDTEQIVGTAYWQTDTPFTSLEKLASVFEPRTIAGGSLLPSALVLTDVAGIDRLLLPCGTMPTAVYGADGLRTTDWQFSHETIDGSIRYQRILDVAALTGTCAILLDVAIEISKSRPAIPSTVPIWNSTSPTTAALCRPVDRLTGAWLQPAAAVFSSSITMFELPIDMAFGGKIIFAVATTTTLSITEPSWVSVPIPTDIRVWDLVTGQELEPPIVIDGKTQIELPIGNFGITMNSYLLSILGDLQEYVVAEPSGEIPAPVEIQSDLYTVNTPYGTLIPFKVYRRTATEWILADLRDQVCVGCQLWIAMGSSARLDFCKSQALVSNENWAWVPDQELYLGEEGNLTLITPTAEKYPYGVSRRLGWSRSATTITFTSYLGEGLILDGGSS